MMHDPVLRLVRGVVTRHEAYGFYLDFDEPVEGLVVITMVVDDPHLANPDFPPVGAIVEAALLGYAEGTGQPRLSTRPADLA